MEAILETAEAEIHRIAGTVDEPVRRRIIDKLRELSYTLEPPEETMQRLIYSVCSLSSQISQDADLCTEPDECVYQGWLGSQNLQHLGQE